MTFFNWFLPGAKKFRPIPKWTHAGRRGKTIRCGKCGEETHVYNFGWLALKCSACKAMTDKGEWLMLVPEEDEK